MFPICLIWLVAAAAGAELRDYPGCGQLGSRDKQECNWDCEYQDNKLFGRYERNLSIAYPYPPPLKPLFGDFSGVLSRLETILMILLASLY